MTRLLEQAITRTLELPAEQQDAAAEALFAHLAGDHRAYALSPEQIRDVQRIRARLENGDTRLATEAEVSAMWLKAGL